MNDLASMLAAALGKRYCILCGRGTTALWLAFRAVARRYGYGEVIIPDILCQTALEGVLLAGFTPIFAPVLPARFTLSADHIAALITPNTRAILVAHLFGHIAEMDLLRKAAGNIPIIEDAVQGVGGTFQGRPAGTLGDLSFISFDKTKMIGGRGGALFFDDVALLDGIISDIESLITSDTFARLSLPGVEALLPPVAARSEATYLRQVAPALLRRFDGGDANAGHIIRDWQSLPARVVERYARANFLTEGLAGLRLSLPNYREGDAIWRYTITAPSILAARRIAYELQQVGLNGSRLYPPLSSLFNHSGGSGDLRDRLINLWVDNSSTPEVLQATVNTIRSACSKAATVTSTY